MAGPGGIMGDILASGGNEEGSFTQALFETRKSKIDKLKMTSEITPELIFPLTCLFTIADKYKSKMLKEFARQFLLLEVSKDRKGRIELVEANISARRSAMAGEEE